MTNAAGVAALRQHQAEQRARHALADYSAQQVASRYGTAVAAVRELLAVRPAGPHLRLPRREAGR
jgi:hypothetical protein